MSVYSPAYEDFRRLAQDHTSNLIPVYRDILGDLETPVSAYLKIAGGDYSFLLESVEGGERLARYSFLGTAPKLVLTVANGEARIVGDDLPPDLPATFSCDDPLQAISRIMARYRLAPGTELPGFSGGMVGYFNYEMVQAFERIDSPEKDVLGVPTAVLMLAETLLIFDHLKRTIRIVSYAHLNDDRSPAAIEAAYTAAQRRIEKVIDRLGQSLRPYYAGVGVRTPSGNGEIIPNMSQARYCEMVERAKEYIYAGDIIQVVLAQRLGRKTDASPVSIYRALRSVNPSPYMYYLHLKDFDIVGASPELLVRVEDGVATTHPIAGTRPRGHSEEADAAYESELRADEKERAEHIMLVDLGRNDIGRVSQPGTVHVTELMGVERYSHVMHLVSHVSGKLRADMMPLDALRACFPAGTVSGAPKVRAMQIIGELEPDRRGPYAGAVGYVSFGGNLDTAITIRTLVIKDGYAYVEAGAGIVADSVPEREYQECLNKARGMLLAIDLAEELERSGEERTVAAVR